MPFGLSTAPGTFQRLMDLTMCGLTYEAVLVYLDDLIIMANSFEQLMERFETVLGRLRAANLKLNCSKCELFRRKVSSLVISSPVIVSKFSQRRRKPYVAGRYRRVLLKYGLSWVWRPITDNSSVVSALQQLRCTT